MFAIFLLSAVSYELSLNPTQLHRSLCLASREKFSLKGWALVSLGSLTFDLWAHDFIKTF